MHIEAMCRLKFFVNKYTASGTPCDQGIEVINGFKVRGGSFAISVDGPFHPQFQTFSRKIDQRAKPTQASVWKLHLRAIDNRSHLDGREIFRRQFPIQSFPVRIPSRRHLSRRHKAIGCHRMGPGMITQKYSRHIPEI
jgi:hypothetical protein